MGSDYFLLSDSVMYTATDNRPTGGYMFNGNNTGIHFLHSNLATMLFADGHAAALNYSNVRYFVFSTSRNVYLQNGPEKGSFYRTENYKIPFAND